MAQLRDDCFAFGGRLIPLDDALSQAALQFRRENRPGDSVALYDALDRLSAHKVEATEAVPPHPNSAVDGYAVRFADLHPGEVTALPTDGYAAAGRVSAHVHSRDPCGRPKTATRQCSGRSAG